MIPLIRTKLECPRLRSDFIARPHLLQRLTRGLSCRLTLLSAPAGYGKSTLLSNWVETCPLPCAWLSLDKNDNDLLAFLQYVTGAIRTLFPEGCVNTHRLLAATRTPPPEYLTSALINDLSDLPDAFLLVLDDYQFIEHPDIHQLVSALVQYHVSPLHLVIATRHDPPFSLARLRAADELTEIRMDDLRFTADEIRRYLSHILGTGPAPDVLALLAERIEGWPVGLRLVGLALRGQSDPASTLARAQGADRYVMEYLVDEVVSQQSPLIETFLQRTAILDRLCASLCDAVMAAGRYRADSVGGVSLEGEFPSGQAILEHLERANLFLIPLDTHGEWFRYHQVFQELLLHRLQAETTTAQRSALHSAASAWFDQNGFAAEALDHALAAHDLNQAVRLLSRQRYALLNRARWPQIEQYLRKLPLDRIKHYPDMLMLEAWLLYHRGQWNMLPAALRRIEAVLAQTELDPEHARSLRGELSAISSLLCYLSSDASAAIAQGWQALEHTSRELWTVRVLGRVCLAGALQMAGDLHEAYAVMYAGLVEEAVQSDLFKALLIQAICNIDWVAANLQGMIQSASLCIRLSQNEAAPAVLGFGQYHLGVARYHQNDLGAAEQLFEAVVQHPYLHYGDVYAYSACGLALTYQAQGRPDAACAVSESVVSFMLETGNTTLLPVTQAFQAELALRQGQLSIAVRWAARLNTIPPLVPLFRFYEPHITLVKVWLAQDTPASRQQADMLLKRLHAFVEATHNTRFLIEVLALQSLLHDRQGEHQAARQLLEQAVRLAQPGGFLRLFVDLGPQMANLLTALQRADGALQDYLQQILDACDQPAKQDASIAQANGISAPVPEPLTNRELDVLALLDQRLSNKEIANHLAISIHTVHTHTRNIFAKLDVHNRRQASLRAQELGLLKIK